jgi:hypothetical protein
LEIEIWHPYFKILEKLICHAHINQMHYDQLDQHAKMKSHIRRDQFVLNHVNTYSLDSYIGTKQQILQSQNVWPMDS